jgi:hypothetical protein
MRLLIIYVTFALYVLFAIANVYAAHFENRVLKKGSYISKIGEEKKRILVPRSIVVKVTYINEEKTKAYILDKNSLPKYFTYTSNLESLNDISKLNPKINPLKVYSDYGLQSTKNDYSNDKVVLHSSLAIEQGSSPFYQKLFVTEGKSTNVFSFNNALFYKKYKLPVHLGIDISYQYKYISGEEGTKTNVQSTFIGPAFLSKISGLIFELGFTQSLFSKTKIGTETYKFSSTGYRLKAQKKIIIGKETPLLIGLQFHTLKHELKNNHQFFSSLPKNETESSWGVIIGYPISWNL